MSIHTDINLKKREAQIGEIRKIVEYDDNPDISFLDQDGFEEEKQRYYNGHFTFVYCKATVTVYIPVNNDSFIMQEISSPGLYGIRVETLDDPYLNEIFDDEKETLLYMLKSLKNLNV